MKGVPVRICSCFSRLERLGQIVVCELVRHPRYTMEIRPLLMREIELLLCRRLTLLERLILFVELVHLLLEVGPVSRHPLGVVFHDFINFQFMRRVELILFRETARLGLCTFYLCRIERFVGFLDCFQVILFVRFGEYVSRPGLKSQSAFVSLRSEFWSLLRRRKNTRFGHIFCEWSGKVATRTSAGD